MFRRLKALISQEMNSRWKRRLVASQIMFSDAMKNNDVRNLVVALCSEHTGKIPVSLRKNDRNYGNHSEFQRYQKQP